MKNKKIAILGATGNIAKGLIYNFSRLDNQNLFLFVRSLTRLKHFLDEEIECSHPYKKVVIADFNRHGYDVIINCVGLGTSSEVREAGVGVFWLAEKFDNMILKYLSTHPATLYINFSSGAAYGTDFTTPADVSTFSKWNINNISAFDYYGVAKLNSETKHRALKKFNIVDLRVFGYFSRFMELDANYLLGKIILCLKNEKVFETDRKNIIRDFIHPKDLFSLVERCIVKKNLNDVFDAYSIKPVAKFEILNYFKKNYGLKYAVKKNINVSSATGSKSNYYSNNKKAEQIGYIPKYRSIDAISEEAAAILK